MASATSSIRSAALNGKSNDRDTASGNPRSERLVLAIALTAAGALALPQSAAAQCPGDCDSSGSVTVDDLVTAINVALGRMPLEACSNTDMDSNNLLDIEEIVGAVDSSVGGRLCSTFQAIQKQIFERRGCTSAICHGSSPGQGGLDLSADVAYQNLFEVPATGEDMNRVEPGSREASFLFLKLAAATDPSLLPTGYIPPGSPMPTAGQPLTDDELEAIRLWIYNGAPETGTVMGTEELLGLDLPPSRPISITPLDPPAPGEGHIGVLACEVSSLSGVHIVDILLLLIRRDSRPHDIEHHQRPRLRRFDNRLAEILKPPPPGGAWIDHRSRAGARRE
jgi:hypothetical protein